MIEQIKSNIKYCKNELESVYIDNEYRHHIETVLCQNMEDILKFNLIRKEPNILDNLSFIYKDFYHSVNDERYIVSLFHKCFVLLRLNKLNNEYSYIKKNNITYDNKDKLFICNNDLLVKYTFKSTNIDLLRYYYNMAPLFVSDFTTEFFSKNRILEYPIYNKDGGCEGWLLLLDIEHKIN